ncbi:MAG: DUF393 domain-containing protein [Planctomycetes bacterium]|nr:DUF393 domain-containing protein [Planctomycetota bacterium]
MEAARVAPDLTAPAAVSDTHDIVVYDDKCPMCTFQMRLLSWLDLGRRLDFLPLSNPEVHRLAPQLKREDLLEAMHVLTRKGPVHRGARAIRYLAARIVLLWPLCVLLWIPGVIFFSEIAYRAVSRNRQFLSKIFGCKGACEVLPGRKRE